MEELSSKKENFWNWINSKENWPRWLKLFEVVFVVLSIIFAGVYYKTITRINAATQLNAADRDVWNSVSQHADLDKLFMECPQNKSLLEYAHLRVSIIDENIKWQTIPELYWNVWSYDGLKKKERRGLRE